MRPRLHHMLAGLGLWAAMLSGGPAWADQPHPWGVWMQQAASPTMEAITRLNTLLTIIILAIVAAVFLLLGIAILRFGAKRHPVPARWTHNAPLEMAWTLLPVLLLVIIAFPSFRLLYAMDRTQKADLTLKVTGHQWYWTYAYPDAGVTFDANLVQDGDLRPDQPRLLSTDGPVILPVGASVRIQVTSDDVVHSWSVPSLGVKTDAIPGRLNETWVRIDRPGRFYGQCSQICGVNHGFMPIEIHAVPPDEFAAWLRQQKSRQTSSAAPGSFPLAADQP